MKNKNSILTAIIVVLSLAVTACGNPKKETKEQTTHEHSDDSGHNHSAESHGEEKSDIEEEKISTSLTKEQAKNILTSYLEIKDALVQTDGNAASKAAEKLVNELGETKDKLAEKIRFDAEHIWSTKDAGHQRDHFNTLSKNVYSLVKHTQANTTTLYLQSCPMEKSNKEALWLSLDSGIRNPYFGEQMLDCGNTKEEIK